MNTRLHCPGGRHFQDEVHRIHTGERIYRGHGVTKKLDQTDRILLSQVDQADVSGLGSAAQPAAASIFPAPADGSPNWIADTYWENTTGSPVNKFLTSWKVPQAPTIQTGQLIYLFIGMDPATPGAAILQPVLQWGVGPAGGGAYWSIATYYVMGNGPAFSTDAIQVNSGDLLQASIALTSVDAGGFNYVAEFIGYAATSLRASSVNELVWCYETLETYGASSASGCYPSDAKTALTSITVQTGSLGTPPVNPALIWTAETGGSNIGQSAVIINNASNGGEVDIRYR